jgi:hypothetical protein
LRRRKGRQRLNSSSAIVSVFLTHLRNERRGYVKRLRKKGRYANSLLTANCCQ